MPQYNHIDLVAMTLQETPHPANAPVEWPDALHRSAQGVLTRISDDIRAFNAQKTAFTQYHELNNSIIQNVRILREWQTPGQTAPSLVAMNAVAGDVFSIKNERYNKAITAAGFLAEVENTLPYHNNMHYRKVALQAMRLISAHNTICKDQALDEKEMSLILIAAAIHDLGHDGKGDNRAHGMHYPALTEGNSYSLASPYLKAVGFDDAHDLAILKTMLCATDISDSEDCAKFAEIAKQAYAHHFNGAKDMPVLPADLSMFKDPRVTLISCMLHEADIGTSAGIDLRVAQFEGRLVADEAGLDLIATPKSLGEFLKNICGGKMTSKAAQYLYDEKMAEIMAQVTSAPNQGEIFPPTKDSALLNS